ncbi:hypothetical protein ACIP9H_40260 [Streptomyces sp. NPDC088732]|uniref:hypothetical protein n=1 Tax=Streptomyces sp. NPDC088732 TaxID=3365879 RepID=UPI003820784F
MSTHITDRPPRLTMGDQAREIVALAGLAAEYADMPAAFITVSDVPGALHIDLQLDSPQDFEVWRAALGIDPQSVLLRLSGRDSWLSTEAGEYRGVSVGLAGFGVELTREQADEPRELRAAVAA